MRLLLGSLSAFCVVLAPGACAESGDVIVEAPGMGFGGNDGGVGGALAPTGDCAQFTAGPKVSVCSAGYLGTGQDDAVIGVGVGEAGRVVLAGNFPEIPPGFVEMMAEGAGPGRLLVMDDYGATARSSFSLEGSITAFQGDNARGRWLVATENQLMSVVSDFSEVEWTAALTETVARLDVGGDGSVGTLGTLGTIAVRMENGDLVASFSISDPVVNDLALSPSGEVFVVGAHDDPSGNCQGRVPFLRRFDALGELLSTAYDFDNPNGNCASSVGRRVTYGDDGELYYAGENQGGNTVHLLDPQDVSSPAPLVSYDVFNQGYGMAIERYGFIARFNPNDLTIRLGQLLLPRNPENIGGQFLIDEILADRTGRVLVSAQTTCCIPGRSALTVAGETLGPYAEPELSVTLLSADFRERTSWFTVTSEASASVEPRGASWWGQTLAVGVTTSGTTELVTEAPLFASPRGGGDGYLLTIPTP